MLLCGTGALRGLEHLDPLLTRLEGAGFSEGLRYVARRSYTIQCNWKVRVYVCDRYWAPLPPLTSRVLVRGS
jgi:hypothetical protein